MRTDRPTESNRRKTPIVKVPAGAATAIRKEKLRKRAFGPIKSNYKERLRAVKPSFGMFELKSPFVEHSYETNLWNKTLILFLLFLFVVAMYCYVIPLCILLSDSNFLCTSAKSVFCLRYI